MVVKGGFTTSGGEDAELILCVALLSESRSGGPHTENGSRFTSSHLKWCIIHFSLEYKK